jgi:general secretion pathway protein E
VAQRLIRRVCSKCKVPHVATDLELKQLGIKSVPREATIYRAMGCPSCSNTGYSGRTVIHELMVIDDEAKSLIIRNADAGAIKKSSVQSGMIPLRDDGIEKIFSGITTIDELLRATHADA